MIRKSVGSLLMIGAAALAACSHDEDGELLTAPPVAGLRYVNIVPDTGAMDFRIGDVVTYAPNTVNATFRTGGQPYGITTTGISMHTPVLAGARRIMVFMNSTNPAIASTVMLDTTYTFDAGVNYTVYLFGYAAPTGPNRPAAAPALKALIARDDPADPGAGNFAIRTIHLAPTMAPTFAGASVDVFVDTLAVGDTPTSAATWTAVGPLNDNSGISAYVNRPVRLAAAGPPAVTALNYRVAVAAATTTTPIISADVPNGSVGTTTVNPVPGDLVGGSAFSVVILPPSVTGSPATAFPGAGVMVVVDRLPPRTAP